jgi:heterodisulfide reductase subunit B
MLNCHDATRLMSESHDRPLSLMERMALRIHLSMCSGCSNFKEQMKVLRIMARDYAKGKDEEAGKK